MKVKIALVSMLLALAPAAGFAMCGEHAQESAANCAAGSHWDPEKLACVPTASS